MVIQKRLDGLEYRWIEELDERGKWENSELGVESMEVEGGQEKVKEWSCSVGIGKLEKEYKNNQ